MSFTLAPAARRNGACTFWPRCVAEVRLIIAHSLCVVMKNISRASEKDPRKVSLGLFLCPTFHAFWVGFALRCHFIGFFCQLGCFLPLIMRTVPPLVPQPPHDYVKVPPISMYPHASPPPPGAVAPPPQWYPMPPQHSQSGQ